MTIASLMGETMEPSAGGTTDGLFPGGPADQALNVPADHQDLLDLLTCWRDVGARLWPFVRYFGLCGGCPESLQAVADLSGLLNIPPDPFGPEPNAAPPPTREDLLGEFCQHLQARLRGHVISHKIEPLVDRIRQELLQRPTIDAATGGVGAELAAQDS